MRILAQRVAVLAAFLMFVLIGWWLRGLAAAAAYVLGGLAFIAIPIWLWDYFRVFEALEIAILLTLVYRFAEALFDLILEWKAQRARARHPASAAACVPCGRSSASRYRGTEDDSSRSNSTTTRLAR